MGLSHLAPERIVALLSAASSASASSTAGAIAALTKSNSPRAGDRRSLSASPLTITRHGHDRSPHQHRHRRADRAAIVGGLSKLLADTYTLYLTTHNFHWNVTGPMFNTLHLMFMTQYTELWNAVDPVAERIRSLGHPAPGSYAQFAPQLDQDVPEDPPKALEMVRILVEGHEAVARTARGIFPLVEKAGDEPTADLLTQRLAVHEQTAWMLRSLLE